MQMLVSSTLNQTRQPERLAERGEDGILQTVTVQVRLVSSAVYVTAARVWKH